MVGLDDSRIQKSYETVQRERVSRVVYSGYKSYVQDRDIFLLDDHDREPV